MDVREHGNYGHGLRPGTTEDLNCPNCKREKSEGKAPVITKDGEWAGPKYTGRNDESTT